MNATRPAAKWREASSPLREGSSMTIFDAGRGVVRGLGFAAAAIFVLVASSQQRAEALSLASPGTAPSTKAASDGSMIQFAAVTAVEAAMVAAGSMAEVVASTVVASTVVASTAEAFMAAVSAPRRAFHGGGYRAFHYGGYRHAYYRPHFHHRAHFHRRFYYAPSYYAYPYRYCRVVWTYYGPHRICHRSWYRHHYRYHRWHHYRYW